MAITWLGTAWAATTAYVVGARVVNAGNVYGCTIAGTSGNAGGPTGTATAITDGTVTWSYLGADGGYVTAIAPGLVAVPFGSQRQILAEVGLQMSVDEWGDLLDVGAVYLAAHLATVAGRTPSGAGPVTSESVGSLSRSYSSLLQLSKSSLGLSSFGVEYQRLMRLLPAAMGAVF